MSYYYLILIFSSFFSSSVFLPFRFIKNYQKILYYCILMFIFKLFNRAFFNQLGLINNLNVETVLVNAYCM